MSVGLRELEPRVVQSQVAECKDGVDCDLESLCRKMRENLLVHFVGQAAQYRSQKLMGI